jgi:hypothetical protein
MLKACCSGRGTLCRDIFPSILKQRMVDASHATFDHLRWQRLQNIAYPRLASAVSFAGWRPCAFKS